MDRNSSAGLRLWAIILATAANLGMLAGPAAAQARRITFSPSDPIVQQSVTFRAENFPNNQIRWDFDDGTPLICQSTIITHTYSRTGTFLVKAKSWCGDDAVTTTVSVTVRSGEAKGPLAPFKISFIQLRFKDGKSYQTVARNAKLKALADIKYEGTGVLQGGWVVDGNSFKQFSQSLAYARSAVIDSGDVQGLPTQEPGRHEVTLRISSPAYDALLPVIRYTVESEEEKPDLRRPKEPEPLHIAGSVQYRHRRRPVAGAAVEYRVYDPKARRESSRGIAVLTDNLGRFIITGVKADSNFRLHIYGRDFRAKVQEGAISDKSLDRFAVLVEDVAKGIRLGGLVSYSRAKTPAAEMNVVYRAFDAKTNSLNETSKKTTVTDDQGRFDFLGISAGSAYALEISSPSHALETFQGKVSAGSGGDLSLEIHRQPAVNEVTPTIPAAGNVVTIKGFDLTWPTAGSGPGQIFLELDERTFMIEKVLGWDRGRIDFVLPDKIVDGESLVKVSQEDGTAIASFKLTCQRKPYEISVEDFKITGCQLLDWEKSLFRLEAEGTLKNSGSRTFSDSLIFKLQENDLFKKEAQEKIDIASGQRVIQKWTFTDFQFAEGNRHDFTIQVMTDPKKSDIYKLDDQENNISQPDAYNPQPRIDNFSGTREGETSARQERLSISRGEKVTLSWKTSGAQQVGLSAAGWKQDGLPAEGSLEVRPDAGITYTLSAGFSKQFTEQSTLAVDLNTENLPLLPPDMAIIDVQPVPAAPIVHQMVGFRFKVKNVGPEDLPAGSLSYSWRPRQTAGSFNSYISGQAGVDLPPLKRGESIEIQPKDQGFGVDDAVEYEIEIFNAALGGDFSGREMNLADNRASARLMVYPDPNKPDLLVKEIIVEPASPQTASQLVVKAVVANQGQGTCAWPGTRLRVLRDGQVLQEFTMGTSYISPGSQTELRWVLPQGLEAGRYLLEVVCDYGEKITETDETNNLLSKELEVKESGGVTLLPPDIAIIDVQPVPAAPIVHQMVGFRFKVKNVGPEGLPAGSLSYSWRPRQTAGSFNSYISGQAGVDLPPLKRGESIEIQPKDQGFGVDDAVEYEIEIFNAALGGDFSGREMNLADNRASARFMVFPDPNKPDLLVKEIIVEPASPQTASQLVLKVLVANQGQGTCAWPGTRLRVLRDGQVLQEFTMGTSYISPGSQTELRWVLPQGLEAGRYLLEVVCDYGEKITETDETNNLLSREIVVVEHLPPDIR